MRFLSKVVFVYALATTEINFTCLSIISYGATTFDSFDVDAFLCTDVAGSDGGVSLVAFVDRVAEE